jgi:isoquinoline 1-oxidoreductase alpha subunit
VHLNGQATRSCTLPVQVADGAQGHDDRRARRVRRGKAVQQAWIDLDVVQCGWCQPGHAWRRRPAREQAEPEGRGHRLALGGNLCRCGTYQRIRAAVKQAGKRSPRRRSDGPHRPA